MDRLAVALTALDYGRRRRLRGDRRAGRRAAQARHRHLRLLRRGDRRRRRRSRGRVLIEAAGPSWVGPADPVSGGLPYGRGGGLDRRAATAFGGSILTWLRRAGHGRIRRGRRTEGGLAGRAAPVGHCDGRPDSHLRRRDPATCWPTEPSVYCCSASFTSPPALAGKPGDLRCPGPRRDADGAGRRGGFCDGPYAPSGRDPCGSGRCRASADRRTRRGASNLPSSP